MRHKKIFIGAITFIVLIVSLTLISIATNPIILRHHANELYKDKDISEIIEIAKNADNSSEIDTDAYIILGEKIAEENPSLLSYLIKTNNDFPVFQDCLIQIAEAYNIKIDSEIIVNIIKDENCNADVRLEAIYYCGQCENEFADLLEELVDDSQFGFEAIRELYTIDKDRAVAIADKIIENLDGTFTSSANCALFIRSEELSEQSTPQERQDFVELCSRLIDANPNNTKCKTRLILYIGDIVSYETLSWLIESDDVSDVKKYRYV